MKISIVTVYNIENCGSFLQAYALSRTLEKMGHQIFFTKLKRRGTTHTISHHLIESLKRVLKLRFAEIPIEWKRYSAFCNAQKYFTEISINSKEMDDMDFIVIGSDTVWNLDAKRFLHETDLFFGLKFPDKNIISYAVSVSNTDKNKFLNNQNIIKGAQKMKAVSVRDINTYIIAKDILKVQPTLVCDPTMLLKKNEYNSIVNNIPEFENSPILIYYFGNLPGEATEQIKKLSKQKNKKIISFGQYRKWCDINLPFDPYLFIRCFKDCSFVITNTYHGTIFSLIYQKNFANYAHNKNKIKYLLNSLGADKAFATFNDNLDNYYDILDYDTINQKIEAQVTLSKDFLKRNLK